MENRSRDTIAGRAAILNNGNTGIPGQYSSANTIASRAAVMKNNNYENPKKPVRQPNDSSGQRNVQNYDHQMTGGGAPTGSNSGNAWTRSGEFNLKVTPPPVNSPIERRVEYQSRNRQVSDSREPNAISVERLKEAIIWSEILGEPVSKRRKRR